MFTPVKMLQISTGAFINKTVVMIIITTYARTWRLPGHKILSGPHNINNSPP